MSQQLKAPLEDYKAIGPPKPSKRRLIATFATVFASIWAVNVVKWGLSSLGRSPSQVLLLELLILAVFVGAMVFWQVRKK